MNKDFPTLYAKNKSGVWKEWKIRVEGNIVITLHGQHGGKAIEDRQVVSELKRGCATLHDQAVRVAQSKWNHKHDRESYQEDMSENITDTRPMPMLAQTYGKRAIVFPVHAQPKIDGLRCMARYVGGDVELYSRTGTVFQSVDHIRRALVGYFRQFPSCILDGELYSSEMSFEELSGLCRRENEQTALIRYHVFDTIVEDGCIGFEGRMTYWSSFSWEKCVCPVETIIVRSQQDVEEYLDKCIGRGYEGVILRSSAGRYAVGHRSADLQKYKRFHEEEFVITGFTEGTGRDTGTVIWECATKDGNTFRVRPKGAQSERREWLKEAGSYVGKQLTVVFQEYTQQGIPRFPVAKAVRENY